jgi:hypothetical protein
MNISEAMCAAADQIERHPTSYRFNNSYVPRDGAQGCMLGFLGRVAGLPVGLSVDTLALAVLGKPAQMFYEEIIAAAGEGLNCECVQYADKVAPAMRAVAKKYQGIPEDVREIFNRQASAVPYPPDSAAFYIHMVSESVRKQMAVITDCLVTP